MEKLAQLSQALSAHIPATVRIVEISNNLNKKLLAF